MGKIILCFVLLFVVNTRAQNTDERFFRLHPKWTRIIDAVIVLDANSDGEDELFFKRGQQYDLMNYTADRYHKSQVYSFTSPSTRSHS